MPQVRSQHATARWMDFNNVSGEEIPAFAVMKITGLDSESNGRLTADQYDQFGAVYATAINGEHAVADTKNGKCTFSFPVWVMYDTGDTPALGESWGPVSGEWDARLRGIGFTVIGGAVDGRVLVDRNHDLSFFGELDSGTIAQDATGTVSVHYYVTGTWTEETDSNHNVTCRNVSDTSITAGLRVGCNWSTAGDQWTMMPAACS